jgi:hypothetical protein
MAGWLKLILTAAVVMVGLWALLVILAARPPPGLLGTSAKHPAEQEAPQDEPGRP